MNRKTRCFHFLGWPNTKIPYAKVRIVDVRDTDGSNDYKVCLQYELNRTADIINSELRNTVVTDVSED